MKKLLAVIDMQKDFIDGSLGTAEAQKILPAVREKIIMRWREGWEIIFTKDTHDAGYLQTQEGKNLPIPHCIKGTEGWELDESLLPLAAGMPVFEKPTFGSPALAEYATEQGFAEIELIGLCTDICVICNALLLKAFLPQSRICVDSSCCAGVTVESHENALSAMGICQIEIL